MSKPIRIFDTTLRDGEQSPGAAMNVAEKCQIAELLDKMGVDVIEAGFAISSPGDFKAINEIAKLAKNATICSLSRAKEADIEAAGNAIKPAKSKRIHTFISTSPIHREYKLRMSKEAVLDAITDSVKFAGKFTDDIEWSAEDATRTERDYLFKCIETAIKAGATTVNIPDTVGYAIPNEYGQLIADIIAKVPGADDVYISTHCQNDLGLASANTLAAIQNGARQAEVTINGIGERAGNTSLEEVVMAINTRPEQLPFTANIDTTYISRVSKLVSNISGMLVQPNKAIVGANAFAHESGIHQDGMLKNAQTYEIITPESIGLTKSSLTLGKLSGRAAFKDKLVELGYTLEGEEFQQAFDKFIALADKKKEIYDNDIIAIVEQGAEQAGNIEFEDLKVTCGSNEQIAELSLKIAGKHTHAKARGNGPVDAVFNCIKQLAPHKAKLKLYQVMAVTQGTDAQAEVLVRLIDDAGKVANGSNADIDTLVASAKAYIAALNRLG